MGGTSYRTITLKICDKSGSTRTIKAPLSPETEYKVSVLRYVAYAVHTAHCVLNHSKNKNQIEDAYHTYTSLMSKYVETNEILKSQALPAFIKLSKEVFLEKIYTFSDPTVLTEMPTTLTEVINIKNISTRIEIIKKETLENSCASQQVIPCRPVVIACPRSSSPVFTSVADTTLAVNYGFSNELTMRQR